VTSCHYLLAPTHTPLCSCTHAHTHTHTNSLCLRYCALITVTPGHHLLTPTNAPLYSLTHACTPTHTSCGYITAHSSPRLYIISPSYLHLRPFALSHMYAHTHTQLVVAPLRVHHRDSISFPLHSQLIIYITVHSNE